MAQNLRRREREKSRRNKQNGCRRQTRCVSGTRVAPLCRGCQKLPNTCPERRHLMVKQPHTRCLNGVVLSTCYKVFF